MRLHEATEKAGAGGKIRRAIWAKSVPNMVIPKRDMDNIVYETDYPYGQLFSLGHVTADDWVVVIPQIEVGDRVDHERCFGGMVLGISEEYNGNEERIAVKWDTGVISLTPRCDLVLSNND
jgi:hypothetical protein